MANAFSAHLPHFRIEPFAGVDLAGLRPLGGQGAEGERDTGREAIARAREEALAEARTEFEGIRAQDLAAYEKRVADGERHFAETTADLLAERLKAALGEIDTSLSAQVARVLLRFLDNAARDRALDQLSETVAALLAAGGAARVRIAGPESLVNRLRQQAETLKVAVEATVSSDAADVTVTIDDTIVETRIAEWMERVTRAANGEPHV